MSQPLPLVSVIIAAPPDMAVIAAVAAARKLDYPADRLEIIVARGRQPSVQRNAALRVARGEWVYFLDDDALPPAGNLRRAAKFFSIPEVAMVGGPNLCPPDAPPLEKIFAVVLASWLAFGPSRARYAPVGAERDAGEKELILCNLLARRAPVMERGGFNEALYPNEENALMDELQQHGLRLVYDPQLSVGRRPRCERHSSQQGDGEGLNDHSRRHGSGSLEGVLEVQTYGEKLHVFVDEAQRREPQIEAALAAHDITHLGIRVIEVRMEEAFISLIRRQTDADEKSITEAVSKSLI